MIEVAARQEFALPVLQHEDVDIDTIIIGERYRKELGDIPALADSIKEQGLLQPVGIDRDNNLVFGERRIRSFQHLGWSRIPVRRVNVTSIVEGEYAENDVREDFRPSERVAIAAAVAKQIGERRGRENPQNIGELKGIETSTIAAQKAGFGNPETLRQARSVITKGAPELIQAMDAGKVAISAAATIAKQDQETQRRIVAEDNMARKAAELRAAEAELNRVKSIPRPAPTTPEEKERQREVFGTKEDRLVWSSVNDVIRIVGEQPDPEEATARIPPSLKHAVDLKEIRKAAMWLADFANAWERKHVA